LNGTPLTCGVASITTLAISSHHVTELLGRVDGKPAKIRHRLTIRLRRLPGEALQRAVRVTPEDGQVAHGSAQRRYPPAVNPVRWARSPVVMLLADDERC
jgi:hypothetical protein